MTLEGRSEHFYASSCHDLSEERIVFDGQEYIIGSDIDLTREGVADFLLASGTSRLVIAHQVTDAGEVATMPKLQSLQEYPPSPVAPEPYPLRTIRDAYDKAMQAHVSAVDVHRKRNVAQRGQVHVPPAIGYPGQTESDAYLYIKHPNSVTTHVVPYKGMSRFPYLLRTLQIVE